ncbi:MAG: hypothetical protein WBM14_04000, partial [Terracidiphilus sp.]
MQRTEPPRSSIVVFVPAYAGASSIAAARLTAITLTSSYCPKVCAALATSAASSQRRYSTYAY